MDYNALKELIKAVSESNLTAFEVEEDGLTIKMSKEVKMITQPTLEKVVVNQIPAQPVQNEVVCDIKANVEEVKEPVEKDDENVEVVSSPIVGTFYGSPGPDEKPFVTVGQKVKKGDTLCIVEAMKLMNDISSEFDGTVVEILVNNEDMVEYGQPIIKIKKEV